MTEFLNCEVKLQASYQEDPLLCIIIGVVEEPGQNFFYTVELSDASRIHISVQSVEWIEIIRKLTDKKKRIVYLKDHGRK